MPVTEQKIADDQASPQTGDAAFSDVLSAWERVVQGIKAKLRTNVAMVVSDLRLSLKAVVVALISILALVGIGLVVWTSFLVALTYGITSFGFHWLWALLAVLILNGVALIVTKKILSAALDSIELQTSIDHLFHSDDNKDID